jgi:uncharacterized protein (DUF1778 family)
MDPGHKSEVEEAAALIGVSLTAFATETLLERARRVKREHALTILGNEDRDVFIEMLTRPPKPSEALVDLMKTTKVIL